MLPSMPKTLCATQPHYWLFHCMLGFQPSLFPQNSKPTDSPVVNEWLGGVNKCRRMHKGAWNRWLYETNSSITNTEEKYYSFNLLTVYGCPQTKLEMHRSVQSSTQGTAAHIKCRVPSTMSPTSWTCHATVGQYCPFTYHISSLSPLHAFALKDIQLTLQKAF